MSEMNETDRLDALLTKHPSLLTHYHHSALVHTAIDHGIRAGMNDDALLASVVVALAEHVKRLEAARLDDLMRRGNL
jgi:hypothetical protein